MGKKIVLISGSPRKNGNSASINKYFASKAAELGANVKCFDAAALGIKPCQACETCFSTGRACTLDDNFSNIAEAIEWADTIAFSTPVYWYAMSAQLKAVVDKLYSFEVGERMPVGKECVLIGCAGEGEEAFTILRQEFDYVINYLEWEKAGEIFYPNVIGEGEIESTDYRSAVDRILEAIVQER